MPSKRSSKQKQSTPEHRRAPWLSLIADPFGSPSHLPPVHLEHGFVPRKLETTYTVSTDAQGFAGVRVLDVMAFFTGALAGADAGGSWTYPALPQHPDNLSLNEVFMGYIPLAVSLKVEYVGPADKMSGTLYGTSMVSGVSDAWLGPVSVDELNGSESTTHAATGDGMVVTFFGGGSRWCNVYNLGDSTSEVQQGGGTVQTGIIVGEGLPASLNNCLRVSTVIHVGLLPRPGSYNMHSAQRSIAHNEVEAAGSTAIALRPSASSVAGYHDTARSILNASEKALKGASYFAEHWAPLIADAGMLALPFL